MTPGAAPCDAVRVLTKRLLPNLALAAASIAACLLLLEAAARLAWRSRGGGKERDEASLYMRHDPRLGWRKRPGAKARYDRREYSTEVAVNGQGLRGPERPYEPPPGTFRVLALGDSFVEGYSVAEEQTVTAVLEGALSAPACPPVEVLNAGTAAWSTDQEYLFWRDEGARYRPQVVLVFFFFNDLVANTTPRYWGAPKPRLGRQGGRLVITNEPVPDPGPPPPRVEGPPPRPTGSVAFAWLRERMARGAPRAYNALARAGLWKPLGGDSIERGDQLRVYKRRRQPEVEEAWDLTSDILKTMAREVEAAGSRFAVVYVPSRMEVSDRDWELTRLSYELDESVWDRGLVARRIAAVGREGSFPVLDLTPALRAAGSSLAEPYFTFDGHWNALGHRTAAEAVAAFLRGQRWAPPCARTAAPRPL